MKLKYFIILLLIISKQLFSQEIHDTTLITTRIDTTFKVKSPSGSDTLVRFAEASAFSKGSIDNFYARYQRLVGQNAPDFRLEDPTGKMVSLHDFAGKVILLDFWFTSCGPCLRQMTYTNPIHDFYKNDSSVAIVSICIDEAQNKNEWKKLIKTRSIPGIHLFMDDDDKNPGHSFYYQEVAQGFPTYIVVSKEQKFLGITPSYGEQSQLYVISNALKNVASGDSFLQNFYRDKNYRQFIQENFFRVQDYRNKLMILHTK